MSMNKVIHCAVRRDLARFRTALADFPDGDRARAVLLGRAFGNCDQQLTHHHEDEHEIVWPALAELGLDQAPIDTFDAEHEAMAAALGSARGAMAALAASATRADADRAAQAMVELETVTTTHLDHEEQLVEPLFLERHDDPVMKEMRGKFDKERLAVAGAFFAWLQDGLAPDEAAALKQNVPGPVVAILSGIFGRRYRREVAPAWAGSPPQT